MADEAIATLVAQADAAACMEVMMARIREMQMLVSVGVHRETDAARSKAHVALDSYLDALLSHSTACFKAQAKIAEMQRAAGQQPGPSAA